MDNKVDTSNEDLIKATRHYEFACIEGAKKLTAEYNAYKTFKEAESKSHLLHWKKVLEGNLSNAMYTAIVKHETHDPKVAFELAKMERKLTDKRESVTRENLYTVKKQISIH